MTACPFGKRAKRLYGEARSIVNTTAKRSHIKLDMRPLPE